MGASALDRFFDFDRRWVRDTRRFAVDMEPSLRVLLGRLEMCADEHGRLMRAMDRGRTVSRLYARIRRIAMMLDMAWSARAADFDADIQARIENLMTWHPTLRKGMCLPAPPSAPYFAALDRLAEHFGVEASATLARLRRLPGQPPDWDHGVEFLAMFDEIDANVLACRRLIDVPTEHALKRLGVTGWDWLEVVDEGYFKLLKLEGCIATVGDPVGGDRHQFNVLSALRLGRVAPIADTAIVESLEKRCVANPPEPPLAIPTRALAGPELIGAWVAWPCFGRVVGFRPVDADTEHARWPGSGASGESKRFEVARLEYAMGCAEPPASAYWMVLVKPEAADDPAKVAAAVGRTLRAIDGQGAANAVPAALLPRAIRRDIDRLRALWLAMKLRVFLQRGARGKPMHAGGFATLRRVTLDARLRAALNGHLLGQIRHEAASRGRRDIVELASAMLRAARRAFAEPASWPEDAGNARAAVRRVVAARDVGWIRIGCHATRRRSRDRLLLVLDRIASDDFVQALILYLFEYVEYRYFWSRRSWERLDALAAYLMRYAKNRCAPARVEPGSARAACRARCR